MQSAKDAARQIIEHLPEEATWDDIMYELYVKQKIEAGLADIKAGRTVPHEKIKAVGGGAWVTDSVVEGGAWVPVIV